MIAPLFTLEPGTTFHFPGARRLRFVVQAHRPTHTDCVELQYTRDAGWVRRQSRSFRPTANVVEVAS